MTAVLVRGGDVNQRGGGHLTTSLMVAVREGHNHMLALLLAQPGLDPNLTDRLGHTALHYACSGGNVEGLAWLLAHHAVDCLNTRDAGGDSPVMMAVRRGEVGCVRELLKMGQVELTTRDRCGQGLVSRARRRGGEVWGLVQGELLRRTEGRKREERRREQERKETERKRNIETAIQEKVKSLQTLREDKENIIKYKEKEWNMLKTHMDEATDHKGW